MRRYCTKRKNWFEPNKKENTSLGLIVEPIKKTNDDKLIKIEKQQDIIMEKKEIKQEQQEQETPKQILKTQPSKELRKKRNSKYYKKHTKNIKVTNNTPKSKEVVKSQVSASTDDNKQEKSDIK